MTSVSAASVDESHADDGSELILGEAVALDTRPASYIMRAAGTMIDWVVYFGVWLLLVIAATTQTVMQFVDPSLLNILIIASLVLCLVIIPATVETISQGKSLGRLALGTRIVRDDGGSIGFRHALIRALLGVIELFLSLGSIAAFVGLLNAKAKRLGDLLAGTYSQHERVPRHDPPVFGVPVELQAWAATADVARMPDPLARRIAQFLRQAGNMVPDTRVRVSRELANEASQYVSPIPRSNPELFLAAVSAVRREREFAALEREKQRLERVTPVLDALPHGFPKRG